MPNRYQTFSNPDANKPKPSFIGRIKESFWLCGLLLLSVIVFAFALFIGLFASSLLGVIFATQESIKYIKSLFQKENFFSSLLSLLSMGMFAYGGWVLGILIGTAIFPPVTAVVGACIFLGWTLGLTALIIKYSPKVSTYCFSSADLTDESDNIRIVANSDRYLWHPNTIQKKPPSIVSSSQEFFSSRQPLCPSSQTNNAQETEETDLENTVGPGFH
ncbi:MAG: hypothetical protein WAL30_07115 [Candidatus Aquirickettsiella sp.]